MRRSGTRSRGVATVEALRRTYDLSAAQAARVQAWLDVGRVMAHGLEVLAPAGVERDRAAGLVSEAVAWGIGAIVHEGQDAEDEVA